MKYVLEGEPNEVSKVLRENRLRIQRGVISVTPLDCESEPQGEPYIDDAKEPLVEDSKAEPAEDAKKPSKRKK